VSFYRVSKRFPPDERTYLTPQDKLGEPPDDASEEKKRSWDALSAFDTEEGARRQAMMFTHLENSSSATISLTDRASVGNNRVSRDITTCAETSRS
jgi:hypothetical protein